VLSSYPIVSCCLINYTSFYEVSHSFSFYFDVTQHIHELKEVSWWFYGGAYLPNKPHILNANRAISGTRF